MPPIPAEPAVPGDGPLLFPAGSLTGLARYDGPPALAGPLLAVEDRQGRLFLATTRSATSVGFGDADERRDPNARFDDPWTGDVLARREGDDAIIVWAREASATTLRGVAEDLQVTSDGVRASGSLRAVGAIDAEWPRVATQVGPWDPATLVVVTPEEQRALWALLVTTSTGGMQPSTTPPSFSPRMYPAFTEIDGGWRGTVSANRIATVLIGDPGVAMLTTIGYHSVPEDFERLTQAAFDARTKQLDDDAYERVRTSMLERVGGGVVWEGELHGIHRLIVRTGDVVDDLQDFRQGPNMCVVDIDRAERFVPRGAASCVEESSPVTASSIGTVLGGLGGRRTQEPGYFDVWGYAPGMQTVPVRAGGRDLVATVDATGVFQLELGDAVEVQHVGPVRGNADGALPGFLVQRWWPL